MAGPARDERHPHAALIKAALAPSERPRRAGVIAVTQPRPVVAGENERPRRADAAVARILDVDVLRPIVTGKQDNHVVGEPQFAHLVEQPAHLRVEVGDGRVVNLLRRLVRHSAARFEARVGFHLLLRRIERRVGQ